MIGHGGEVGPHGQPIVKPDPTPLCAVKTWALGCTLAPRHGGPHHDPMGIWWQRRPDPPDWTPPRYTVLVDLRGPNGEVMSSVVVAADQETTVDLTNHFGLVLAFKVRQIPEGA